MTRKHKKKKKEAEEERQEENQNKAADPEYVREKKKGILQLNFRYTHQMLTFKKKSIQPSHCRIHQDLHTNTSRISKVSRDSTLMCFW